MTCEKCGKEFNVDWRKGKEGICRFCSSSCARSRVFTEETNRKRAVSNMRAAASFTAEKKREISRRSNTLEAIEKRKATWLLKNEQRIDSAPFEDLSGSKKRYRIKKEQDNRCARCQLDSWQDKPITLELHHIDGNRRNNARNNLVMLCPNCHSLTDNYKCANNKKLDVTDDQLLDALLSSATIHAAIVRVGLSPQRNTYNRCRRILAQIG